MKQLLWLLMVVMTLCLLGVSCTPKRWIKEDPRTLTPEPTIVVDETVRVDLGGNTGTPK